jgi:hypothetical protein
MKHGTARKLTRAATLSLLVFATTSGVAGIDVLAASPAMAQPNDQGSPFGSAQEQQPADPVQQGGGSAPGHQQQPSGPADGLTGLIGGLTGGGGSNPGSHPAPNPGSGTPTSPGNPGGGGPLGA